MSAWKPVPFEWSLWPPHCSWANLGIFIPNWHLTLRDFYWIFTLLTHLNSVGTNIWKGALISWRWWNAVILRQSACHEGLRTNQQRSQVPVRGCLLSFPLSVSGVLILSTCNRVGVYLHFSIWTKLLITNILWTQR